MVLVVVDAEMMDLSNQWQFPFAYVVDPPLIAFILLELAACCYKKSYARMTFTIRSFLSRTFMDCRVLPLSRTEQETLPLSRSYFMASL